MKKKKIIIISSIFIFSIIFTLLSIIIPHIYSTKQTEFVNIDPLILKLENKTQLTIEEQHQLSLQTGLSSSSITTFLKTNHPKELLKYQNDHINNRKIKTCLNFPFSYQEILLTNHLPFVDIHDGDIIISSSSHTLFFRHGHSGLVLNGTTGKTIESYSPFTKSSFDNVASWYEFRDIMLLRLKDEYQFLIKDIVKYAEEYLINIPYSILASANWEVKNNASPKSTQCSHLVYTAFKAYGIDLNTGSNFIVTANDISKSDYLEVVEVKGFNYDKLW